MNTVRRNALSFCFASGILAGFLPGLALAAPVADLPLSAGDIEHFGLEFAQPMARTGDRRERITGRVTVPPDAVSVVTAPMDALITRTHVANGMPVAAGDTLFTLTSPALIDLQTTFLSARDEATYQNSLLERDRRLAAAGAIPERRLEATELAQRQSANRLASLKLQLRATGLSEGVLAELEQGGRVQREVTLRASVAGVVSELDASTGERVPAVTPLAHITSLDRRWVEFEVPQPVAAEMHTGQRVAIDPTGVEARIINIGMMIGDGRNLVTVRCELPPSTDAARQPGSGPALLPGQFVAGHWLGRAADLISLPTAALVHQSEADYVFVAIEGGVAVLPVEVITRKADSVQVRGDLSAGDRIVVRGTAQLKSLWLSQDEGAEGAE